MKTPIIGLDAVSTSPTAVFEGFPKIARLSRNMVITEKIDGTNSHVLLMPLEYAIDCPDEARIEPLAVVSDLAIMAGSRNRLLTLKDDNYGFAAWVVANANELATLGIGRHYGEWWGKGIQRHYDMQERRFSLFNVERWLDNPARPACCHVVPVVGRGEFDTTLIRDTMDIVRREGSKAAPGFMKPEGVMVWHEAGRVMFKKTFEKDEEPKGRWVLPSVPYTSASNPGMVAG